jgi:mRNA interferase RelE/StbE
MIYSVEFRSAAIKDMSQLSPEVAQRIVDKIELLKHDLSGDVKRLRNYLPRYRLRVGDWRVLFEVSGSLIQIWRVLHRSNAYDR